LHRVSTKHIQICSRQCRLLGVTVRRTQSLPVQAAGPCPPTPAKMRGLSWSPGQPRTRTSPLAQHALQTGDHHFHRHNAGLGACVRDGSARAYCCQMHTMTEMKSLTTGRLMIVRILHPAFFGLWSQVLHDCVGIRKALKGVSQMLDGRVRRFLGPS
jgi:hypothetical protein